MPIVWEYAYQETCHEEPRRYFSKISGSRTQPGNVINVKYVLYCKTIVRFARLVLYGKTLFGWSDVLSAEIIFLEEGIKTRTGQS